MNEIEAVVALVMPKLFWAASTGAAAFAVMADKWKRWQYWFAASVCFCVLTICLLYFVVDGSVSVDLGTLLVVAAVLMAIVCMWVSASRYVHEVGPEEVLRKFGKKKRR